MRQQETSLQRTHTQKKKLEEKENIARKWAALETTEYNISFNGNTLRNGKTDEKNHSRKKIGKQVEKQLLIWRQRHWHKNKM